MVDDPHSSLISGETTVADTLPPFESDVYGVLNGASTTTLDPDDDLSEPDDLGADSLSADLLGSDVLSAETLIVEAGDVEVIVSDGPVLEGTVAFHADGQDITASPGTWIQLPRGSRHFFKNTGTTPARMLILVNPAGLEQFFAEVGRPASGPDEAPLPPSPAEIEKLLATAPKYGIEIHAPAP